MLRILICFSIILLFSPTIGYSQFSLESRFNLATTTSDSEVSGFNEHIDLSLHYWTRLKKVRIEFYPGLIYQNYINNDEGIHGFGLTIPTAFYILDMINDCDCPTFSKNDYFIEKGLFLRLAPSYLKTTSSEESLNSIDIAAGEINVGLDIGVSDLITLTPLLGYKQQFYPNSDFETNGFIQVGLSMLWRPDYKRRYR
ncbi:hypothetical protein [Membranihabitans marinus]|uniref:hypothetical protein n=1 Tax=Membranihabitans marinus TaxID=1227546 RepID=UPI001F17712B|nr:hypothetical protein [Membranihabitans marinus]